ncbi:hypothetical protein SADUNF_Sadunf08G0016700 [Salix dunnii]|uniref:RAB6-interacting golgin n=1 Tax=Salix dunnii TaxID=1413687 RepID=A0A835JSH1_9ROSI|nr:hypothetical protein SADUNF_Sadunf08G0016700 [Salix dunnii]
MRDVGSNIRSSGRPSTEEINEEEEIPRLDMSKFQAREEEIRRRMTGAREKVELQLRRAEQETRRLTHICKELEVLTDPFWDRCYDYIQICSDSSQQKEHREALEYFNEKNKEKPQLGTTLSDSSCSSLSTFSWQLLTESERQRMKRLEELDEIVESKC